ncbi:MAG: hypothetical protein CMI26_09335 [Opitutae bacterium]|nr:hypothetical protein [Opitutae bacterium]|tara:strand:- start:5557 stop:6642 length:1086 start_codon:yes stop_codon:yes gene_type:complete
MKRRKRDDGGSLDSLLDTITTVVGILIILLIVVQLGTESAVKRYVEEQKEEDSKGLMESTMKPLDRQKELLLAEKNKLQLKLASENKEQEQVIKEISKLENELAAKKKAMPPVPPKLQNLRQEKTKLDKDKKAIEVKVKKVKGLLAKVPKPTGQTLSKEVSLPDPKPAPPKAKPFRFLCRGGKIYPLDDPRLINRVTQEIQKAGIKPNKAKEYDGKKILAHFSKAKPGDPFFQAVPRVDGNKRIIFDLRKKSAAGEDEAALAKTSSKYLASLKSISPKTHYLQFEVFEDSFAAYLSARDLASKRNFPAGWKPVSRGTDTDCTLGLWTIWDLGHAALMASRPRPKPPTGKPAPAKKPPNVLD